MALERYVRMRKAYEKELAENPERQEPELGARVVDSLEVMDRRYEKNAENEHLNMEGLGNLSMTQQVMMGLSVLVVMVACVLTYKVPTMVTAEFFGAPVPAHIAQMLGWNRLLVWLPVLTLLLGFVSSRHSYYLGTKMLVIAFACAILFSGISCVFSYFVISVGA
ncbi:MAG: hypothetical protein ACRCWR_02460 [Saezia sp.]